MDIEHALICELVIDSDMSPVADARITENYFLDDRNRSVFKMVLDHWHQYGSVPDAVTIQQAYPSYKIAGYPEPIGYYINSLRDRHQERIIVHDISNTF